MATHSGSSKKFTTVISVFVAMHEQCFVLTFYIDTWSTEEDSDSLFIKHSIAEIRQLSENTRLLATCVLPKQ